MISLSIFLFLIYRCDASKFYAVEICETISFIHNIGYVYRLISNIYDYQPSHLIINHLILPSHSFILSDMFIGWYQIYLIINHLILSSTISFHINLSHHLPSHFIINQLTINHLILSSTISWSTISWFTISFYHLIT